jgi:DNA-binding transcriptional LysR family regulator
VSPCPVNWKFHNGVFKFAQVARLRFYNVLMLPDIDSLALFVRAAEMQNLTRAAQASFITVPAASRRLGLLEHQFKAQLFERHSRGMQLTPAGEHLLKHAREVIASVNRMRAEMGNYAQGRHTVMRVLGNTSAMAQFLPSDIARFQANNESIRVLLEESWSDEVVRRVRTGEADVGVVVEGCDVEGLWTQPYRTDQLAVVMRVDDSIAKQKKLAFSDLADRDLVGLESGSTLTRLIAEQAQALERPMALRVQVRSFEAVCRAVQARLGVGILPLAAARGLAETLKLRAIALSDEWASRRMLVCLRAEPGENDPLAKLAQHLVDAAKRPAEDE